jgi:hypothetical protein
MLEASLRLTSRTSSTTRGQPIDWAAALITTDARAERGLFIGLTGFAHVAMMHDGDVVIRVGVPSCRH